MSTFRENTCPSMAVSDIEKATASAVSFLKGVPTRRIHHVGYFARKTFIHAPVLLIRVSNSAKTVRISLKLTGSERYISRIA